jgi:hypothetical protein
MMDKKGFKITLTPELSEELFFNALCNSLGYMCSGYGLRFAYNKTDYKKAKLKLATSTSDYSEFQAICYEDVLMQVLRDGNKLSLIDEEGDEDTVSITLADVHARVQNSPSRHILDMINEHDDAVTGDAILQTVFLGEIVYG